MVFNTTQAWVTKSEPEFFLGQEKVAYTWSYTYLSVTFVTPRSPHGRMLGLDFLVDMLPLVAFERKCAHIQFNSQKLNCGYLIGLSHWLLSDTWGPSLFKAINWQDLERALVSMITCMIKCISIPHDIIQEEMLAAQTITKALFWIPITGIQWVWEMPIWKYSRSALMSSKQLPEHGDDHCW